MDKSKLYTVQKGGRVLYYRGLADRGELDVKFLINKHIAGNIAEFYSIDERVTVIVIKHNKGHDLKVVLAYAPTSSYDGKIVESFYKGMESALSKLRTHYTVLMGDFNARVGKKQAGDQAVRDYGVGSRNSRKQLLVEFAERNNLRTFFRKRENRKWTWKSPNGGTKNETDFILCAHPGIGQDVEVLGKVRCSDHRMVWMVR